MLLAIREKVMGIVGWIVLGILFIAFAFFGLNSYLQSNATNAVAKINDVEITPRQYQSAYNQMMSNLQRALGAAFDPAKFDDKLIRESTINRLVNDELVLQAAEAEGFTASERQIAERIKTVEGFQKDGVFSKERYIQVLRYQGLAPREFEWRLKQEIMANQLKTGIALTAAGTEQALREAYRLEGQRRRFNYLLIPASAVADKAAVADQEIEDYYAAHPGEFMRKERVRIAYVELNAAGISLATDVDEDQIKALYEEQREKFVTPEQRRARHILVQFEGQTADDVATARTKAEAIEQRLEAGESFETLARTESDDPASAPAGGDLGFFARGLMTPEFENTVYAMAVGERSPPVQTEFGFHIIELLEITPEVATPLEDVREQLVTQLLDKERGELFYDQSETLSNLAFEQPDSLQGAADALGLKIVESDWIERDSGTGIAADPDVREAIFTDDVLVQGNNSQAIEIGDDHVVVLRILEHQPAEQQTLDSVRERVVEAARQDKTRALLEAKGAAVITELDSGKATMDSVAVAESLKLENSILLPRNAEQPSRELVGRAFSMPLPKADKPVYSGVLLSSGDYALIALEEVQPGDYDALPEDARKQAWRALNEIDGSNDLQLVLGLLKSQASIRIPRQDEL
ncbi:MAG TPA: SurA N-terminal domain-containing protein [Gammaproteobacteria bacterium]|nr:SurA N-terminal domain-containing protein [Gammaproteobacteria bacterium]